VEERFAELTFAQQVIDSLTADETLDGAVRDVALQIVTTLGDNAFKLNRESAIVVTAPGQDTKAYRLALRKAEAATRVVPSSPTYLSTLGAAKYRLEQYEPALTTLRRADELYASAWDGRHPRDVAFIALTLHQLGRAGDAQAELKRLRSLMKEEPWVDEAQLQAFLDEAELRIVGGNGANGNDKTP